MISDVARASERLFVQLHRLIREGRDDGGDADRIRDELDEKLEQVAPDELRLLQQLSGDLYLVTEENVVPVERRDMDPTSEIAKADVARKAGRWADALEHFRTDLRTVSRDRAAYFRGRGWYELGWHAGALAFFDYAYELNRRPEYLATAIDSMVAGGENERLKETLEGIERDASAHPTLSFKAALTMFNTRRDEMPEGDRSRVERRVIALVERGRSSSEEPTHMPSLVAGALVACGFSYEHLGDGMRALACFDEAIAVENRAGKETDPPYVARGAARLSRDPEGARADFAKAVELKTPFAWPYFYLTHHALTHGDFSSVSALAGEALKRTGRVREGRMRAKLFEWWAIASAELGKPVNEVASLFDAARSENPSDLTVEHNARAYQAALAEERKLRIDEWERSRGYTDEELRNGFFADWRTRTTGVGPSDARRG